MKICFMCDLHLPQVKGTVQYRALEWAINDVIKKQVDCIVYAGDVTARGDLDTYKYFINRLESLNVPFLYIPGNSDLRCETTRKIIHKMASKTRTDIGDVSFFALNDSDKSITDEELESLNQADDKSIVFLHHNMDSNKRCTELALWRERHPKTMVFFGHEHISEVRGNNVSLQALDADKAIGESPCITYYDTETKEIRKAYYFCPPPVNIYGYFGLSCFGHRLEKDVELAINRGLRHLELHLNLDNVIEEKLITLINRFREQGNTTLSIHLPEVGYSGGKVDASNWEEYLVLGEKIKAERYTQHVPNIKLSEIKSDSDALNKISKFISDKFNALSYDCIIGVENMHVTKADIEFGDRRFGYTPEETLDFMQRIRKTCRQTVGINFDIGHARNNAPYSQIYPIGSWLALLGKDIVGYHIHQVIDGENGFANHMPITDIYGKLISFASFFRNWAEERISYAPVIFEMRPENAYATTLDTFDRWRETNICDMHSHTYYSNCSGDDPHNVIRAVIANGINVLGITDHSYWIKDRKETYLKEIRSLAQEYKDRIKIVCGIEIPSYPHLFDINNWNEIKDYDYCLIEHITEDTSIVGGDLIDFCKKAGITCGIAHTDMFEYCDKYGYEYTEFLKKMAENGIFWEMNVNYDRVHKYREHKYVFDFMNSAEKIKIIKDSGVLISVGFDSHKYGCYDGVKVYEMNRFLKQNGIKTFEG